MTDYQRYINALRKCAKEHENDRTSTGHIIVSDLCRDTANLLEALEQEPTTKNDLGVDCIPRIEVIDYLCKHCPDDGECFKDCDEIKHLRQMPSVTPQEPRKGYWILTDVEGNRVWHCNCSECSKDPQDYIGGSENWWLIKTKLPKYCPNCGSDNREVEE